MDRWNGFYNGHNESNIGIPASICLKTWALVWEWILELETIPFFGSRYPYDNPAVIKQFQYLRSFLGNSMAGPITTNPWLKSVPPTKGIYWNIRKGMDAFRVLIKQVVEEQRWERLKGYFQCLFGLYLTTNKTFKTICHPMYNLISFCSRSTFDEGHMRGYIDMFLVEQKEKRGSYFTDEDLIINCQVNNVKI